MNNQKQQIDIFQDITSVNFDQYSWELMKTPNSISQKTMGKTAVVQQTSTDTQAEGKPQAYWWKVEWKEKLKNWGWGDWRSQVTCWCLSTKFYYTKVAEAVYQAILDNFMLPSADELY